MFHDTNIFPKVTFKNAIRHPLPAPAGDENPYLCEGKILFGMSLLRALVCIFFPPLAVLDKGCGAFLLVLILTCCGWIPGVIAAILFNTRDR